MVKTESVMQETIVASFAKRVQIFLQQELDGVTLESGPRARELIAMDEIGKFMELTLKPPAFPSFSSVQASPRSVALSQAQELQDWRDRLPFNFCMVTLHEVKKFRAVYTRLLKCEVVSEVDKSWAIYFLREAFRERFPYQGDTVIGLSPLV